MGITSSLTAVFKESGYVEKTTFGTDFDIADALGEEAIKNTFEKAFAECKNNCEYLTELVIAMNYKCCQWYYRAVDRGNQTIYRSYAVQLAKLYNNLYYEAAEYASTHFEGDDWSYYDSTTDSMVIVPQADDTTTLYLIDRNGLV